MRLKPSDLPAWREQQLAEQCRIDPIGHFEIIDPCVDHQHSTGRCRMVLDRRTNAWEGKVLNAFRRCGLQKLGLSLPDCLIRLAAYVERDWSSRPLHPKHKSPDEKRLARNKKARSKRKKKQ